MKRQSFLLLLAPTIGIIIFRRSRNNSNDSNSSMSSFGSVPFEVVWKSMFETHKTSPIPGGRCSSPASGYSRNTSPKLAADKKYKNLLQEFCQKNKLDMPDYDTKDELDQKSRVLVIYCCIECAAIIRSN